MARIAFEARALSTLGGGVRTYTMEAIRRILSREADHEYHIYYDTKKFRGTFPGTREHAIPVVHPLLRIVWDYWLLPSALKRDKIDLVHYFKPATTPWRKPLAIATIYDIIPLLLPYAQTREQRKYWNIQFPLVARTCEHILTISESSKGDIVKYLQVSPERITVAPPGISKRFSPTSLVEQQEIRQKYKLPKRFLLFVGTIEPRKNILRLLRAFGRISTAIPHQLVIAGKWGWLFDDVKKELKNPQVKNKVRILSYVTAQDLPSLYSAAEIFVFPSLYEGFGLPVLEAMACGTPVITSTTSSLPEVAGNHALFVNPEDEKALAEAIKRLAADVRLRDRLRRGGLERVKVFTWDRTASIILETYQKILMGEKVK